MKLIATLLCALVVSFAHAQLLSWSPQFITEASSNATITCDAVRGNLGLVNHNPSDVYVHLGVITSYSANSGDWKHVQSTWATTDSRIHAVSLGNNKWTYTITGNLRTFFGLTDANEKIQKIAILFRSGDGNQVLRNRDGSDMYVPVYDANLQTRINQPYRQPTYAPIQEPTSISAGQPINITAVASTTSSLQLFYNGAVIASKTDTVITASQVGVSGYGNQLVVRATANAVTKSDTMNFYVNYPVMTQALPGGLRDGINYGSDGTSATLVLYAPQKTRAAVIGEFNNWTRSQATDMYRTPDGLRYWITLTGLTSGKEYAYQYVVDDTLKVADMFAEKILDPNNDPYIDAETYPNLKAYPAGASGIVSVLQTSKPTYTWQANNFTRPDKRNLVIYELLVRDFVAKHNWNTVRDTLSYLKRLGVNAIEVMPFTEFEGNISWGYNVDFFFAPDKYYGPESTIRQFVDECHKQGIAVIMDMVMNHAFGSSPTVQLYWDPIKAQPASNNPWHNPVATHPYSVGYDFNHESTATQELVQRVVENWLTNYKIDGFRWDLSKGFTQTNTGSDVDAWGHYDNSRITIWKRIYDTMQQTVPGSYCILEHFADNDEQTVLSNYGMLLWSQMYTSYQQAAMGYDSNWDFGYDFYTARGWNDPTLVSYQESHDQERLMYKNEKYGNSSGAYSVKNLATGLKRNEMTTALWALMPGPKMIYEFGELGYDISRCYLATNGEGDDCNTKTDPKPIHWEYKNDVNRAALYSVYARLMALRNYAPYLPAFTAPKDSIQWNVSGAVKWEKITSAPLDMVVMGNFGVVANAGSVTFPHTGIWYDYLNGTTLTLTSTSFAANLQPGEYHVYLDQNASAVLPLQIISFSGNRSANAILLNWTAANEVNLSNYTVERSFNGRDFSAIGSVSALNVSQHSYVFADKGASAVNASGNVYYRLKSTEKNGTVTYSSVVKIDPLTSDTKISLYPNPAHGAFTYLKMNGNVSGALRVSITDASGRVCSVQTLQANGSSSLPVTIASLTNGLYNVKVTSGSQPLLTQKIIIQR